MRVVAVVSQKGGVGKSTMSVALAALGAADPNVGHVLLVDTDPQQNAAWWVDRADNRPFDHAVEADPELLSNLRAGVAKWDLVVVDTPGSFEKPELIDVVVTNADFVIVPCEPAALSMEPLLNTVNQHVLPAGKPFRILINKSKRRTITKQFRDLIAAAELPLFDVDVREYAVHTDAAATGRLVTEYRTLRERKPAADIARVYTQLMSDLPARQPRDVTRELASTLATGTVDLTTARAEEKAI